MRKMLVTGSCGLIGSEVCLHFHSAGWQVRGLDNNSRAAFFGPEGDTGWNLARLTKLMPGFQNYAIDIRDRRSVSDLVAKMKPDAIVHCAAQPSHDLAARIPCDDFDTNAGGTLNLLEAARSHCKDSPFVYISTNKVYGDAPNRVPLKELDTRWEYADPAQARGIGESFPVDQCLHSLFGVSKLAADLMVQEYGRYFGMYTCCLRGGCLTGPAHSGVELHGFLSYLVRCNMEGRVYKVYGYKGKQVRDNLHSYDVARLVEEILRAPRKGEVYNMGGGKENSCSILEAFAAAARLSGKEMKSEYEEQNRIGDHICYYSDLSKIRSHYPAWRIERPLDSIFEEIYEGWEARKA